MSKKEQGLRLYQAIERLCMQADTDPDETVDWLCGQHGGMSKLFQSYFSPKEPNGEPLANQAETSGSPVQQEPVAWMFEDDEDNGHKTFRQSPPSTEAVAYLAKWNRPAWVPLYTLPPTQKRPQNCGTGYCSCIECVMDKAGA